MGRIPVIPRAVTTRGLVGLFVRRGGAVTIMISRFKNATKVISLRSLMRRVFNSVRSRRSGASCVYGRVKRKRCMLSNHLRVRGMGRAFSLSLPRTSSCLAVNKLVLDRCRDFPGLRRVVSMKYCRFGVVGMAPAGVRLIQLGIVRW